MCSEVNVAAFKGYADFLVKNGVSGVFGQCVRMSVVNAHVNVS